MPKHKPTPFIPTDVVTYTVEVFIQYSGWWVTVGQFTSERQALDRCRESQHDGKVARVVESRTVTRELEAVQ